ncbi:hypothetical protein FQN50_009799 [Emmonsiellopsis sp. PD_5]|nr:hypothetical protein FQN50_009799 [Emmonsiellopsis sp. PD_5]
MAFIHPGCVDKEVAFSYADKSVAQHLFCSLYEGSSDQVKALAVKFAEKVPENEVTVAELQGYLMQYKNSAEEAVKDITGHSFQGHKG